MSTLNALEESLEVRERVSRFREEQRERVRQQEAKRQQAEEAERYKRFGRRMEIVAAIIFGLQRDEPLFQELGLAAYLDFDPIKKALTDSAYILTLRLPGCGPIELRVYRSNESPLAYAQGNVQQHSVQARYRIRVADKGYDSEWGSVPLYDQSGVLENDLGLAVGLAAEQADRYAEIQKECAIEREEREQQRQREQAEWEQQPSLGEQLAALIRQITSNE